MIVKLERNKPHQVYRIDGVVVPSYSAIGEELNKRWMKAWANKQGLAGVDLSKDTTAVDIGSIAHFMIDCHLNGNEPDLTDYAPVDVDKAKNAYNAYLEAEKKYNITPIKNEIQLTSRRWGFGGTPDLYCELDGLKTLVDFKTSTAIFKNMNIQLAAYRELLEENGYTVEQQYIFRIDKETAELEDKRIVLTGKEWKLFLALREVYYLRKELKI